MVLGTAVDLRKASMQQRAPEADLSPQVRTMQLELAAVQQRERALIGERDRLRTELESAKSEASEDFSKTQQGRIQELQREALHAKLAADNANKRARELEAAGAEDTLAELARLRTYEAEQQQRDKDREASQSIERQRVEVRMRELVEGKTALENELSVVRRELTDLKSRAGKKR